jgi:hypothetical protein
LKHLLKQLLGNEQQRLRQNAADFLAPCLKSTALRRPTRMIGIRSTYRWEMEAEGRRHLYQAICTYRGITPTGIAIASHPEILMKTAIIPSPRV